MNESASIWALRPSSGKDRLGSLLLMTRPLFLKDWAMLHLSLQMALYSLPVGKLAKPPFGNPLPLSCKNLIFPTASADILDPCLRGRQPMYTNKKLALVQGLL